MLPADDTVMDMLTAKHPPPAAVPPDTLFRGPVESVLPSYFDSITEETIKKAAKLTKGAGGLSQLDAKQFHSILVSGKFKKEGKDLHEQVARLAKKLATSYVDPATLESYVACRLLPLNKNPGVRPIGIGEILRRIIGKAVGWCLRQDIQEVAGPL